MGNPIVKLMIIAEITNTIVRKNTPRSGPNMTLLSTSLACPKSQLRGFHCGTTSRNIGSRVPNATQATV